MRCMFRNYSTMAKEKKNPNKMKAWQVHSYNEELQLTPARIPIISQPNDVLVRVEAASVNPLDTYMRGTLRYINL